MENIPPLVIEFSGSATIRRACEIAESLKQALASSERVEVDCSGVTEVDITFVQLLLAAHREAKSSDKILSLSSAASGALLNVLTVLGIQNGPGKKFWFGGRDKR
jgi:ABC-type transporter Mla MlaB component